MAVLTVREQTNRLLGLVCLISAVGLTLLCAMAFLIAPRPAAYASAVAAILLWGAAAYFGLSYFSSVELRLTGSGYVYLLGAMLVGLAAVNSQMPLGFVIFGVMMGALHVSASLSRRAVQSTVLRREAPERAWQNQTVHLGYFLRNLRKRGSALGLRIEELTPAGVESVTGFCLHLPAGEGFHAGGRFVARRRGRVVLQEMRLSTVFPFGLVRATRRFSQPASLVVWCARGRLKRQILRTGARQSTDAPPSPFGGGSDEFFGVREYRPDDNPRWIHWRRSALRATPVVREMARPLPDRLWVVVDTFRRGSTAEAEGFERRLRFAATLMDHAFSRGYQAGVTFGHARGVVRHPPATGVGQRHLAQDALAGAELQAEAALPDVLAAQDRAWARDAVVVVVGPDESPGDEAAFEGLRRDALQLEWVGPAAMAALFEDDPFATEEE